MDLMDYRRKIIANSPHLSSAEGAVVTFADGADLPLKSLLVDIEPVQSGTGDPSPTNDRPISGWNGVKVTRTGVNVWDEEWEVGSIGTNGEPVPGSNNTIRSKNYIPCKPGTSYCIPMYSTQSGAYVYCVFQYDADKNYIGFASINTTTKVFTTVANAYYLKFRTFVAYGTIYNHDISINYPSTDHSYHPYNGVNVSIDLGQTVYGATINPLTGVVTVDRLGVPMESLTWYRSTSYANPIFYTTITGKASDYRKSACSILRNIGSSTIIAAKGFATQSANGDFASSNGNAQIYARYDSATTVQEFVTAVTGQTIVYPLANPVTIQLTPQQIRTLYGNNTIFADTGNIALEYWAHQ